MSDAPCWHGPKCSGTGPDCAAELTPDEARAEGWAECYALYEPVVKAHAALRAEHEAAVSDVIWLERRVAEATGLLREWCSSSPETWTWAASRAFLATPDTEGDTDG